MSCGLLAASIAPARAEVGQAALLGLARDFVDRIGGGFARADDYMAGIRTDEDAPRLAEFDAIPDGELMLLQLRLGRGMTLPDTLIGIKQGRDVFVSLRDFSALARFAIDVDADSGRAAGWFIREDQPFALDVPGGLVTVGAREFIVSGDDVLLQDKDIYVRTRSLATWMNFDIELDPRTQTAAITTKDKWPLELMMERRQRRLPDRRNPPVLPREFTDYTMATTPNVDISVNQAYARSGTGNTARSTRYAVTGAGDLLGHTGRVTVTGSDRDTVQNVRLTLSKESENPDLLGPLGARYYEFGDISATSVPLSRAARTGFGVRATSGGRNATTGAATRVDGEGQPGWEVEIYRDNQLLALATVDNDGRYNFENVPLRVGDNEFKIVQYGPQGELREETRNIVSSARLAGGQQGVYDASVSVAGAAVWPDNRNSDEHSVQFSGMYETQLASEMTARVGARSVTEGDERKNFGYIGLTKGVGRTVINADAAYDLDGAVQATASARQNLGRHAMSAGLAYAGADFDAVGGAQTPASYEYMSTIAGPIVAREMLNAYYDLTSTYQWNEDGDKQRDTALNLSGSYRGVGLGQTFRHLKQDYQGADNVDEVLGSSSIRGSVLGTRVRATANYEIAPDFNIRNYVFDATRRLARSVRSNLRVTHQPELRYTEARAALSWSAGSVIVSPTVSYDTDSNLGAFLNLRTSLSHDPATGRIVASNRNLSGSGGFSAFVFLDRDGDGRFDPEIDELLPDVVLRAPHAARIARTNDKGVAFIYDMPAGRATDVMLDESSLGDAFWISAFPGVSVVPRPGYVAHAEFPVHIAGELDGTVNVRAATGSTAPLRGAALHLYDMTGRRVQSTSTAPDGFYLFDRVPPGRYLLMIDDADARRQKFARPAPQEITIGYEGTVIYGNNITVDSDGADVPVGFADTLTAYLAANPGFNPAIAEQRGVVLDLGAYRSQLLMGLVWYEIAGRYGAIVGGGRLVVPPSQSYAAADGLHRLLVELPGAGLGDAVGRCRALAARGLYCAVAVRPDSAPATARTAQVAEGVN